MKQLFLASSIENLAVAKHIAKKITRPLKNLKAVFIPTAGEPEKDKEWIKNDRNGLNQAGVNTFDYTITGKNAKDLERDLGNCDLIHVNGGDAFYLLLQMQKSGFDMFIQKQIEKGVIYTGSSAGSEVLAPNIEALNKVVEQNIYREELTDKGLKIVDFLIFPHWGSPLFKDLYLNQRLEYAYKKGNKIILLNDDQYVEVNGENYKIVDVSKDK